MIQTMEKEVDKDLMRYVPLIDFFAQMLGTLSEVVLHDTKTHDLSASIVYIKNGLTGRTLGSPATDFLINILKNKTYLKRDCIVNYRSKSHEGHEFLSSSYFIKDDRNDLIGMICVNTDQSTMNMVGNKLEEALMWFSQMSSFKSTVLEVGDSDVSENLVGTMTNIIDDSIHKITGQIDVDPYSLNRNQKISIVKHLYDRDFFVFKNAVSELACVFRMSEVSIYKYIQNVKQL